MDYTELSSLISILLVSIYIFLFALPLIRTIFQAHVEESLCQALEEDMTPSVAGLKSNWLELQSKILPKKYKEFNVRIAGEAIKVEVSFRNPLQIPISVSSVCLICKHSVECDKSESGRETSEDASLFDLSEVDISMQSGETVLVQLSVTPKVEGTFKLVGVGVWWKLSGSVIGICNFQSDIVGKKVAEGKRKPKKSVKDNLEFLVIKSLPRLEGTVHSLPRTVYAGEVRCLTMELRNPSKTPIMNLMMRITHSRFLHNCSSGSFQLGIHPYFSLEKTGNFITETVFVFPEKIATSWETPISFGLELLLLGSISLYITTYYEDGSSI